MLELHGNIERNYCIQCKTKYSNEEIFSLAGNERAQTIPRCARCNGLIRPDVVWFGEILPADVWNSAVETIKRCDILFTVGTSAVVYPAASLVELARKYSSYIVEINIETTPFTSYVDETILGKSGEVFPQLVAQLSSLHLERKIQ